MKTPPLPPTATSVPPATRTRRSRLALAYGEISRFFQARARRVLTTRELATILAEHRSAWKLPVSLSAPKFIHNLEERGDLHAIVVEAIDRPQLKLRRYAWREPAAFDLALSLRSGSYLSHASAVYLHGLTEQIPRTIYVNKEQTPKPRPDPLSLTQQSLDRAFANKARETTLIYSYDTFRIAILSGKATSNLEVSAAEFDGLLLPRTRLERTLIDITVRPIYGGGPLEVLAAYRAARPKLSIALLLKTLRELDYVYPYHQAIGFYMERAGYDEATLSKVAGIGVRFDFYLGNRMKPAAYSERWRIHYPTGLQDPPD